MDSNIHGRDDYVNNKIDLTATITNIKAGFMRLFWVPLVLALIIGGLFFLKTWISYTPQYTAEATFTVEVNYGLTYSTDYYNNEAAQNMATVFPYILQSTQLSNMVAEELEYDGPVPVSISASVLAETNMFTLTAQGSDPQLTYDALCATMEIYPRISDRVVGGTTMKMIDKPIIPTKPSNSMTWVGSAKKGIILGLILGILVILAYAFSRNTIQDSKYISRKMNVQCLGQVKHIKTKKHRNTRAILTTIASSKVDYSFREAFRVIRTRVLKRCRENHAHTLLISSTFPGEGKTTCAINLAMSLAETGKKVILADCDLRKDSVYRDLRMDNVDKSIEDFIAKKAELSECLYNVKDSEILVLPSLAKMYDEASEVTGSEDMKEAIEKLKESADYVIIDSSPVDMMSDALALSNYVDAAMFVVRYNYGKSKYILKAIREMMETSNVIGYIFNGVENYARDYGYGGKYSSYKNYGESK